MTTIARIRLVAVAFSLLPCCLALGGDAPHPHGGMVRSVGRHHVELVTDKAHGGLYLHVLDAHASDPHPIREQFLLLELEPEVTDVWIGGTRQVKLLPLPRPSDPPGTASSFFGKEPQLGDLGPFRAELRIPLEGRSQQATFRVDPQSLAAAYTCPMRCEGGRTYSDPGPCPKCEMTLRPLAEAHGDHSSRHGGILFMAPDGWHHLEGVVESPDEFCVYLYNDFTQPISARPLLGRSRVGVTLADGSRKMAQMELASKDRGDCLRAALPEDHATPLEIVVWLAFEGRTEVDRFDFSFEAVAGRAKGE